MAIRGERVGTETIRGQYVRGIIEGAEAPGYREEQGVSPTSGTETFAALPKAPGSPYPTVEAFWYFLLTGDVPTQAPVGTLSVVSAGWGEQVPTCPPTAQE